MRADVSARRRSGVIPASPSASALKDQAVSRPEMKSRLTALSPSVREEINELCNVPSLVTSGTAVSGLQPEEYSVQQSPSTCSHSLATSLP